jgi:DNA polymerase III subunit delta'
MNNPFSAISGYEPIKQQLTRLVKTSRIPQALLFSGPDNAPKREFAEAFAKLILSTDRLDHPDLHRYLPEGKVGLHTISAMRSFTDDVYLAPFESDKKVFIIHDADRMLPAGANALLKTFEEPSEGSVIILVTSKPASMLTTIMSRCQKVRIEDSAEISSKEKEPLSSLLLESLAGGALSSYGKILQLVDQLSETIESESKELESGLQSSMTVDRPDQLTAIQREALNKEIDGLAALQKKSRVGELLLLVLSWYRDLHLLNANGNRSLLMNRGFEKQLVRALESTGIPNLALVEKAVSDAMLSLERSTSVKICFENLFLRLI